jgi:uncharacterized protein YndB with AHSA1/START domain
MTYRETFRLQASADVVFDALLDEKTLRTWLAEDVHIDPRKGGAFHIWGHDVIWCATEDETEGEILELDRPRALTYSWRWKGHQTRVSFQIAQEGPESLLSIVHEFETMDPGSDGPGPDMAGCHWRIAIGNLKSVLANGRPALRPDYTRTAKEGAQRVELEIEINASPERVFRALLDPDLVSVWMQADAPEIDVETKRYSYGWQRGEAKTEVGPVRIIELIPNRLLVHDWQWVGEADGQVRWELSASDGGTLLKLTHSDSNDFTHTLGWSDALVSIEQLLSSSAGGA